VVRSPILSEYVLIVLYIRDAFSPVVLLSDLARNQSFQLLLRLFAFYLQSCIFATLRLPRYT
jgi:hypothetical protein